MLRFIIEIVLFAVIQICLVAAACPLGSMYGKDSYFAAFSDKINLIERAQSPRVIVIGGSSVPFGVSAEILEKSSGLNAVNFGLHGALGLLFTIETVRPHINAGDLLVVNLEYPQLFGPKTAAPRQLLSLLLLNPGVTLNIGIENIKSLSDSILNVYFERFQKLTSRFREIIVGTRPAPGGRLKKIWEIRTRKVSGKPEYRRSAFNAWGDVSVRRDQDYQQVKASSRINPARECAIIDAVELLNNLYDICMSRGADMVLVFPAWPVDHYEANKSTPEIISETLSEKARFSFLGDPSGALLPKSLFFDTEYHLTDHGQRINSLRIAHLINAYRRDNTPMIRSKMEPQPQ